MANVNAAVFNRHVPVVTSDTPGTGDLWPFQNGNRLTDALYVGGAGIVAAVMADGTTVNYTAVAGEQLPIAVRRVGAASTATLMVALYAI